MSKDEAALQAAGFQDLDALAPAVSTYDGQAWRQVIAPYKD